MSEEIGSKKEIWSLLQVNKAWSPDDPREEVELLRKQTDAVIKQQRKRETRKARTARLLGEWSDRNPEEPSDGSNQTTWL